MSPTEPAILTPMSSFSVSLLLLFSPQYYIGRKGHWPSLDAKNSIISLQKMNEPELRKYRWLCPFLWRVSTCTDQFNLSQRWSVGSTYTVLYLLNWVHLSITGPGCAQMQMVWCLPLQKISSRLFYSCPCPSHCHLCISGLDTSQRNAGSPHTVWTRQEKVHSPLWCSSAADHNV